MNNAVNKKKTAPRNTAREAFETPMDTLATLTILGVNETIYRQEARGQQSLVNSDTLPTEMSSEAKKILEASGVKFGNQVDKDPLFQYVELPIGWKKVSTDHSMWSRLVDDKGRERASIFYKAAFYDRSARLSTIGRYSRNLDCKSRDKKGVAIAIVTDCDKIIHKTEPIPIGTPKSPKAYEAEDTARLLAEKWLYANYPNWKDDGAYWD